MFAARHVTIDHLARCSRLSFWERIVLCGQRSLLLKFTYLVTKAKKKRNPWKLTAPLLLNLSNQGNTWIFVRSFIHLLMFLSSGCTHQAPARWTHSCREQTWLRRSKPPLQSAKERAIKGISYGRTANQISHQSSCRIRITGSEGLLLPFLLSTCRRSLLDCAPNSGLLNGPIAKLNNRIMRLGFGFRAPSALLVEHY